MTTSQVPLDQLTAIADDAGEAALQLYRNQEAWVRQKADGSPVTEADMASEQVIRTSLQRLDPSTPYLSEELSPPTYDERKR